MSVLAGTFVLWIKNLSLHCISGGNSFCACSVTEPPNWKAGRYKHLHIEIQMEDPKHSHGSQTLTRYCARIPWLDDARVRPDKILPRWCCFDLKINWANWTRPSLVFFSSNTKPGSIFIKQNAEILRWTSRNRESYGPWMRHGARCCSPPWDCNSTASPAQLRARIQRGEIPRKFNQSQCERKYQEIRTTYTRRWAPRGKPRSAFRYLPLQPPDQINRKRSHKMNILPH